MFVCFRLSGGVVLPVQRTDHQSNRRRFMSNHTVPLKSFRKWCVSNRWLNAVYRIVRLVYRYSPINSGFLGVWLMPDVRENQLLNHKLAESLPWIITRHQIISRFYLTAWFLSSTSTCYSFTHQRLCFFFPQVYNFLSVVNLMREKTRDFLQFFSFFGDSSCISLFFSSKHTQKGKNN